MARPVLPAAPHLVEGGAFQFGTFAGPFGQTNALDARVLGGLPIPRRLKALRLKEWQAVQVAHDDVFVNFALFNAKLLALAQVKIYDRQHREKILFERKVPPWSFSLPTTLLHSRVAWTSGKATLAFDNDLEQGRLRVHVDLPRTRKVPAVRGELVAYTDEAEPLVVAIPFGKNHGMYSHKGQVPVEGELTVGDRFFHFEKARSSLMMDDHKGYYPLEMRWDWLCASGFDEHGARLGLNLTRNASRDPERFNENCLWIDGRRHLLPAVRFARDLERTPERWTVQDAGGQVAVQFDVEMPSDLSIHAGPLRSDYRGPYGPVSGDITTDDGTHVRLDGLFGMGEDFYLRA